MLQDLAFGRLENEFYRKNAHKDAIILCYSDGKILVNRSKNDVLTLPTYAQVMEWSQQGEWEHWNEETMQYVFRLQDTDYFIWMGKAGECSDEAYQYEAVRPLRQLTSKHVCFAIMTGWHLYVWYQANRFCGRCGTVTVHDEKERMMRCPECGNMIFPKIAPAVIIGLTDGDRILMSQYAGRNYKRYALIAGFVEIGETAEETVAREVMEEVGLKVKNIRYYKSQPWGVESDLLLGYYCDLDGDDTVRLDRNELSMAEWYHRDAMPEEARDDGISLTREMMRVFREGKEPR